MVRSVMHPAQNVIAFSSRPKEHLWDGGYVKSCRRLFAEGDSVLGNDRRLIGAWIEMYHTAAWKPTDRQFGETWVQLQPGQLIVHFRQWATRWHLPLATFYRACKRMEKEGRIRIEVKQARNGLETAFTVVTVVNWALYQAGETASEQHWNIDSKEEKEGKFLESDTDSVPKEPPSESDMPPAGGSNGRRYAFEGRVIKLLGRDFKRWKDAYPNIDLKAELTALDDFYAAELTPAEQKKWFVRCSQALANRHEHAKGVKPREPQSDFGRYGL